jgi:hypothetical protein
MSKREKMFMRLIKSVIVFTTIVATIMFTQTSAFANTITYTLTGASFNDGSSLNGSWTIDWDATSFASNITTTGITSLNLIHGIGTGTSSTSSGKISQASTFDITGFTIMKYQTNNTKIVGLGPTIDPANLYELRANSTSGGQFLNLDFISDTGAIYTGNNQLGTNLDLPGGGYVAFFGGTANIGDSQTSNGSSPVVTPEPGTIFLLGFGLLGMVGFFRWRRSRP